jgi:hypothetical protein
MRNAVCVCPCRCCAIRNHVLCSAVLGLQWTCAGGPVHAECSCSAEIMEMEIMLMVLMEMRSEHPQSTP